MIRTTKYLEHVLVPQMALLIYHAMDSSDRQLVEAFDIAPDGSPVNAHPLSHHECIALAKSLATSEELDAAFLRPKGILPDNLLYSMMGVDGIAIWYTRPQQVSLRFVDALGIPSGTAHIPAMVWKANKQELQVFSFLPKHDGRPAANSPLYHAPFFNVYETGKVCMGTVRVQIESDCPLEDFILRWQDYFFNSYFSHLMVGHVPVKSNIVQLWKDCIIKGTPFDEKELIKTKHQLKDLIL